VNGTDLGISALPGITIAAVLAAVIALVAIRRWSDQSAIVRAKAQAKARLFELRLFMDDPIQILRSQRALIAAQSRVIRLLLPSFLVLVVPMALLMWVLDGFYGRAPLRVGEVAVVLAESRQNSIKAPEAVIVETKPIFLQATGETTWRIRPVRPATSVLEIGYARTKIVAGSGIAYLPHPLTGSGEVRIHYPSAMVFGFHWLVWFLLLSAIAAMVLRRVLRVVF
jgi:hypothetical protein